MVHSIGHPLFTFSESKSHMESKATAQQEDGGDDGPQISVSEADQGEGKCGRKVGSVCVT